MTDVENVEFITNFRTHKTSACPQRKLHRASTPTTGRRVSCAFESFLKRFTSTEKWRDPWFRRLSIQAKALQIWLWDNCDNAGVVEIDLESASFDIGEPINENHLAELESRLQRMANGKVWMFKFIPFQYGTVLSEKCVPHLRISELLKSHGLAYPVSNDSSSTLLPTLVGRVETTLRRGQGEDKDQDQEKRGMQGGGIPTTELQAVEWASMEMVPKEFAIEIYHQEMGRDWMDGANQRVTNFRSYVKARYSKSKRMVSENGSNQRSLTPSDIRTIIQAKESQAATIKNRYCSEVAMGETWNDQGKRSEFFQIRKEIKTLQNQLSNYAKPAC